MKLTMRFQPGPILLGGLLLVGMCCASYGQETIRPQFLFGGSIGGSQTGPNHQQSVIGQVAPHPTQRRYQLPQEVSEIRPLPPTGNSTFGFPSNPATGQPASTMFQRPNSGNSVPAVPHLGYPGDSLPMSPQYLAPSGSSTPDHWGQPFEQSAPVPAARRPVVIPNEAEFEPQEFNRPAQLPPLSSQPVQNQYDFDRHFGSPSQLPEAPLESTVINEGFRQTQPTVRGDVLDDYGQEFDFENKKREYPPFKEIMATGRYFGNAELLYVKPYFQNNTAITVEGPGTGQSEPFDFGYDTGHRFLMGFESKYGPGMELNYFQYDHQSRPSTFTSSGGLTGETATWMMGPSRWTRLTAANPGETLRAEHSMEVQNFGVSLFKDWQMPISRMGGGFGIQYVSIAQDLRATLTDSGGSQIGQLTASHDFRAIGPKLEFKYFRPVGHTKLEMIGGISGAVLFGNRDQFVSNSSTLDTSRIGADEMLMIFDVVGGVQYVHKYADKRSFYARITLMSQAWMGGGTALLPQDDFGFRGLGFAVGFNR